MFLIACSRRIVSSAIDGEQHFLPAKAWKIHTVFLEFYLDIGKLV